MMTVENSPRGWFVMDGFSPIAGPFSSNEAAWRWIDRQEGDAVSASEKRGEYMWEKLGDIE